MTKRRVKKKGEQRRKQPQRSPKQASIEASIPSAQTFFRILALSPHAGDLIRNAGAALKPALWLRDSGRIRRIKGARTPGELLDLAADATGLAEEAWHERMRQFGPEVMPLISERLKSLKDIPDKDTRTSIAERLIADLRWRGRAGADVLLERFDDLGDYERSQACLVLGLLGAEASADTLWEFYQKVVRNQRETYFVGALWGLIDLNDKRVGGALVDLLNQGRDFYELFGFLSMAGDAGAVGPLFHRLLEMPENEREDAFMALVSIAHRIGRDALLTEIDKIVPPGESQEQRAAVADRILSDPASKAEEYFSLYYRGLTSDDVAQVLAGGMGL